MTAPRARMSPDLIVTTAIALADAGGVDDLSMRRLGRELGVEAMSLYHHLPNKRALLDAMVDAVLGAVAAPEGAPWNAGLRLRARSLRGQLRAHPWAAGLLPRRTTAGPATLRRHEQVLAYLVDAGFGVWAAGNAAGMLDAYVIGAAAPLVTHAPHEQDTADLPLLAEFLQVVTDSGATDDTDEFEVGLDLLMDAIARELIS